MNAIWALIDNLVTQRRAIKQLGETLTRIEGKVNQMGLDLTALNAEVAAIVEDVTAIKGVVTDLKTLVQTLTDQLAAGALDQQAIDNAAATLKQADADLDAITAPPTV